MIGRFVALPVGQGDAFLYEHPDARILIDGGRATISFPLTLREHSKAGTLDVAVCTHADADHANGILGLLRANTVQVRQVWLPGRWSDRLADLCQEPGTFFRNLAEQCAVPQPESLEELGEQLSLARDEESEDRVTAEVGAAFDDDVIGNSEDLSPRMWPLPPYPSLVWEIGEIHEVVPQAEGVDVFWEAVDTALRIREIARAAWHHGAQIRWFDHRRFETSGGAQGGEPFLRPLNAVEGPRVRRRIPTELEYLALSVANRESLVFHSRSEGGDVLFTADSDLKFLSGSSGSMDLLVTAPHHGSESNAFAYGAVASWHPGDRVTWVRSDGRYEARPGETFLKLGQRKFCTTCRSTVPRPTASLEFGLGREGWTTSATGCSCVPRAPRSPRS